MASTVPSTRTDATVASSLTTTAPSSSLSSLSTATSSASSDDALYPAQSTGFKPFPPALLDHVAILVLQRSEAAQNDQTGQVWTEAVISELLARQQASSRQPPAGRRRAGDAFKRLTRTHFRQADDSGHSASDVLLAAAQQYLQVHQSDLIVRWAAGLAEQAWMRYAQQQGLRIGQQKVANAPEYPLAQPSYAPYQQQTDRRFDEGYFSESESQRDDEDDAEDLKLYGDD